MIEKKITGIGKIEIIDWSWLAQAVKDYYAKKRQYWTTEIKKLWLTPSAIELWKVWKIKRISWKTEDILKTLDIDLSKYLKD